MQVADADHIDRLISCVYMALPFVVVWTVFDFVIFFKWLIVCLSDSTMPLINNRGVLQAASSSTT